MGTRRIAPGIISRALAAPDARDPSALNGSFSFREVLIARAQSTFSREEAAREVVRRFRLPAGSFSLAGFQPAFYFESSCLLGERGNIPGTSPRGHSGGAERYLRLVNNEP